MKIYAVVPTYNRPNLITKNLDCLLAQTYPIDKIILVDNESEKETFDTLKAAGYIDHEKIQYIRIDDNKGASGGFKIGMLAAYEAGAEWIWGMDDDAFPEPDALKELVNMQSKLKVNCLMSNCDEDTDFVNEYKKIEKLIFVGFFISKILIDNVGYPDERYYMYYDDTDYGLRILKSGFDIYKIQSSIIEHLGPKGRGNSEININILGYKFKIEQMELFRIYYNYRNIYYIYKQKYFFGSLKYLLYICISFMMYLIFRKQVVKVIWLAFKDVIKNNRGKKKFPDYYFREN